MKTLPENPQTDWEAHAPLISIRNEQEYDVAVKRLNELLDEIGTDEKHPLYVLLDTIGTLVYAYEEKIYPME